MGENQGKESEFNWASLFLKSLDEQATMLSSLVVNLTYYNPELQKYNYQAGAEIIISMFTKLSGHLSKEEYKEGVRLRKVLNDSLEYLPMFNIVNNSSIGGDKSHKVVNRHNYNIIREVMFAFQVKLYNWIEIHSLGTPTRRDPSKAVTRM